MNSASQRNCLGVIGLGSLGATIGLTVSGNIEYAVMAAALAPTCFALRSDIFSPENIRNLEEVERGIHESIDYNDRQTTQTTDDLYRRIDDVERELSQEITSIQLTNND